MISVSYTPVTRTVTPIPNGFTSPAIASAQRSSAPLAAEYGAVEGIPHTPGWLETSTMRPRPARRMPGNSSLVSATGPNTVVANICSHRLSGVSSTIPAAEMPALCTTAYGAPTDPSISLAAAVIDAASVRSRATGINRGSSAAAPVVSASRAIPASTDRIAATTRHPRRYRWVAEARPSPREAPVMTTLRGPAGCRSVTPERRTGCSPHRVPPPDGPTVGATTQRPVLPQRSEEHTSELQSRENLVCRLLLEKKKTA